MRSDNDSSSRRRLHRPADGKTTVPLDAPPATQPGRFHGSVPLDSKRVGRDASRIADEVISHLSGLVGANVTVAPDIGAVVPSGFRITWSARTPGIAGR